MTTGDSGGSCVTQGDGARGGEGVRMGGKGAVVPVASWGLLALVVRGKC
jgi:hypothetical protein